MKKLIIITEHSEEGSFSIGYDYDTLPSNVKETVDKALENKYNSIECNIYENALQYLLEIKHPSIQKDDITVYYGNVDLYDKQ
jgi:hypothetical protein